MQQKDDRWPSTLSCYAELTLSTASRDKTDTARLEPEIDTAVASTMPRYSRRTHNEVKTKGKYPPTSLVLAVHADAEHDSARWWELCMTIGHGLVLTKPRLHARTPITI